MPDNPGKFCWTMPTSGSKSDLDAQTRKMQDVPIRGHDAPICRRPIGEDRLARHGCVEPLEGHSEPARGAKFPPLFDSDVASEEIRQPPAPDEGARDEGISR